MEDTRKRDGSATDGLGGEDILAWLSAEEDTVSQLMELLDGTRRRRLGGEEHGEVR
jgi:hypothetical protein